jgi:8-oxo-dGTP diphosphatase
MKNGTACFLTNGGITLFLYRNRGKEDIHQGYYVAPGGTLEEGERSIDCIIREIKEETGLRLMDPRLRVIATFFNKGRILNGEENPEDWKVEFYDASAFNGRLKEEKPEDKLVWVTDSEISKIRMYEGDRKLFDLIRHQEGVFEVILQYSKENLIRFDCKRVYH